MDLGSIEIQFKEFLEKAQAIKDIEELRIKYLGKKGVITETLRNLASLQIEERRTFGQKANEIKFNISKELEEKLENFKREERKAIKERTRPDITLPGYMRPIGSLHPLTQVTWKIQNIFIGLGFHVVSGPEIETDYYNFEALNIPSDHPAREMWDSFYLGDGFLLRTHTSPVQIHEMEKRNPPLKIVSAGKCYRRDAVDATHSYQFHQMEGFMVDINVTFGDLKGVLSLFAKEFFGSARKIRFRPSYFPFTEPSAEVDIDCFLCNGNGCRLCGNSGWIEILGAGMIHPFVFRKIGLSFDPEKFTGFAFGVGIERLAMLSYGINDIRLFFENDIRFLSQFP